MTEPLKKEDMIRGVIVNADEYKSDDIISPVKIDSVWVNLENLQSAVQHLKDKIQENESYDEVIQDYWNLIDDAFPDLNTSITEQTNDRCKQCGDLITNDPEIEDYNKCDCNSQSNENKNEKKNN